jgi:hypothetical protein
MNHPLALIQLVSEQTMQNLLPVLRLQPSRVVHLVTPKTANKVANIQLAIKSAGIKSESEVIHLSHMPSMSEISHAVSECVARMQMEGLETILNFTGGTKLMSIGSFAAAQAAHIPSLYVDTQDSRFVDGATSPRMNEILQGDWSFTPLQSRLQLHTLAIANGIPRVTGGKPWEKYLPLARMLFEDSELENEVHASIQGPQGICPHGSEPRSPEEWIQLLQVPIAIPEIVGLLAVDLGLLRQEESQQFFLPNHMQEGLQELIGDKIYSYHKRLYKALAPLQESIAFLSGAWWEVIVADAMNQSGLFRDIRWSIQVGSHDGPDLEEDLLALRGVQLIYVNCKRRSKQARLLPLLEELKSRGVKIGGSFSKKYLALLTPPSGKVWDNLKQQAQQFEINLITGQNVYHPDAFY